ncbi:uncharacterized protein BCR38DRAFT_124402 [Pseudomassariella vexata]|uniref:Zn(2)-C6 fungal-type domain-containing protein n=1 Tax=Pseudomassariella vexata TaxID=1141098 RepID=A0A1Y2D863_9PEZI|nr:uncharacterized protein BCR38DRAFT_124402 [Pseudomassariella vexata]ORY55458.1 hypothetical protein BCR38DRAFT_124402 [Pseudomassariella vexata]
MERPRDAQSTGHDRQPLSASSVDGSGPKSNNRTKAGLRVSVACVQCRSKHVKCDATLPCCLRCKAEDKPCFYAKSRRGIRDPKKRSLISDKPPATSSSGPFLQLSELPSITIPSQPLRGMLSWNLNLNPDPMPMPSITRDDLLLDAYYKYFQPNHPWLPPKRVFVQHVKSDPHSMDFLLAVMRFVGSLYLPHVLSDDLRDGAYASACGTLPMTPQTVQGLLILGVVAFGESKLEYHAGWTNRAVSTALDIGMQRKDFAEAASDPVIAESYRRTYWGLYFQDTLRRTRQRERGTPLCEIACSVDLPCEEWEFESGQIPDPMSLAEYDLQNNLGETEFSSFSLLVDMCRITGTLVLPCCYDSEEKRGTCSTEPTPEFVTG